MESSLPARIQTEQGLRSLTDQLEERVKARTRALAESRDQFTRLFHASPVAGTISTLADGRFLDVNERFVLVTGYSRDQAIGQTATELDLWQDPAARAEMVALVTARGAVDKHELRFRTRSGDARTALASIELIELEGELCILGMYVDITDRIKTEQQIQALSQALILAEQRERRRLSTVLHDDLQQLLFSLEIRLYLLKSEMMASGAAQPLTLAALSDIERMMQQALTVTRTISLELNPPILRSEGLPEALAWLATHMEERYQLQVDLEMDGYLEVASEEKRILLVQFVRELLFNVAEHAGSNQALVVGRRQEGRLTLAVADRGQGFDVEAMLNHHRDSGLRRNGLSSLQNRLRLFGGRLQVDSRPGEGTRVSIELPLLRTYAH